MILLANRSETQKERERERETESQQQQQTKNMSTFEYETEYTRVSKYDTLTIQKLQSKVIWKPIYHYKYSYK